jgi:hypothetical protein
VAGTYVFNLVVNDGKLNSSVASTVTVIANSSTATLKISITGTLPASTTFTGTQFTLTLPANVAPAIITGTETASDSVGISGLFTPNIGESPGVATARYIAATGKLLVAAIKSVGVAQTGEILTIHLKCTNGAAPTVSDFAISGSLVVDSNANTLTGLSATVSSVTML